MTHHPSIQIVDEHDRPVSAATIAEAQAHGLTHRIARIMVDDGAGNLLLQKRTDDRRLYPGRWDNSAAGHVDAGESYLEAAARELAEEIGLKNVSLEEIGSYYHEGSFEGLILKRFNRVYRVTVLPSQHFDIQPEEVAAVEWFSLDKIKQQIQNQPELFTDGVIDVINRFY